MKGVIFVELLKFVDEVVSPQVTEDVIAACKLASKGYYTSVGTYDDAELTALVGKLSEVMETPEADLCFLFGQRLLKRFSEIYPVFFENVPDAFAFLETVDNHIHVEVKKLYPDAQVPQVLCERLGEGEMVVTYRSHRQLLHVAHGLILGALEHYNTPCDLSLQTQEEGGLQCTQFNLTKLPASKAA